MKNTRSQRYDGLKPVIIKSQALKGRLKLHPPIWIKKQQYCFDTWILLIFLVVYVPCNVAKQTGRRVYKADLQTGCKASDYQ